MKGDVFSFGELDTIIRGIAQKSLQALQGKYCFKKQHLIEVCQRILNVPEMTKAKTEAFLHFKMANGTFKSLEYSLPKNFLPKRSLHSSVPNPKIEVNSASKSL
ncbi:MAG: hypothetical protein H0U70_03920 [Tatlockia sp.]|nr:hypothetical protein [Tatlockia sp.]